ncbi:MAG TPA: tetratricopeptide repeat protein [Steroidobacteraceae bacterium]
MTPFRSITIAAAALLVGCQTAPREPAAPEPQPDPSALTVMAEVALQKGDCRAASDEYSLAAERGAAELARRASEVSLACHDLPDAWKAAERWRTVAPGDRNAELVYGTVALMLYRIPPAHQALTPLVAGSGRSPERDALSLVQLLSDDPGIGAIPTLAALGQSIDAHTASPLVIGAFGALALEAYDFHAAELRVQQLLERDGESGTARRLLARVRMLNGDGPGAIAAARDAMRVDPTGSTFELADVLTGLDRLEEARQELERLRRTEASPGEIDRRLALIAFESGDMTDAKRRFRELIDRGEANESALLYLGDIAARTGDQDGALTDYRQLTDTPVALTAIERAAGILLDRGQRGQALELLDSYESAHPETAIDVALAKADLLADHGDAAGGLVFLGTALQRFPQEPRLAYERATLLERAGHTHESVQAFEQLLHSRPEDPNLLNALGYTLADHRMQLRTAESLIRRALAASPDNPAMLDSLGWVQRQRNDFTGALPTLERAYLISRDPEIAAHWGEALWASGRKSEARKVLADALARNPESKTLKSTVQRLVAAGRG